MWSIELFGIRAGRNGSRVEVSARVAAGDENATVALYLADDDGGREPVLSHPPSGPVSAVAPVTIQAIPEARRSVSVDVPANDTLWVVLEPRNGSKLEVEVSARVAT